MARSHHRAPQIPLYMKHREKFQQESDDRYIGLKACFLMLALVMGIIVLFFSFQQTNNSEESTLVEDLQHSEQDELLLEDPVQSQVFIPQGTITIDTSIGEPITIHVVYDTIFYNHTSVVGIDEQPQFGTLTPYSTKPTFLASDNETNHFYVTYVYSPNLHFVGIDKIVFQIQIDEEEQISNTTTTNQTREIYVRTRVSPVFTKPLLNTPKNYVFPEAAAARTAMIKGVLKQQTFKKVIPDREDWFSRRYNTCAIVGNGGSLRGKNYGEEIDSHDLVIRFNGAPTKGFEKDVGLKMDIGFAAASRSRACWKWNATYFTGNYELFCQAVTYGEYQNFAKCASSETSVKYHLIGYRFVDLADSLVNFYEATASKEKKQRWRSSGLMATLAAATVCDHLTLYGFNNSESGYHHYFDSKRNVREWWGHSYPAERRFYSDLVNGYGAFKEFFHMYHLPKSVTLKDQDLF